MKSKKSGKPIKIEMDEIILIRKPAETVDFSPPVN